MGNAQVLFVDDDIHTANNYAIYISKATRFLTKSCSTPDEAISIVKSDPIAVVVLDQDMPLLRGTNLFEEILKIKPNVKAVMMSGIATRGDMSDALRLGYVADVRKDSLDDLIPAITKAYSQYLPTIRVDPINRRLLARRGINIPFFPRIEYKLDWIEQLESPHVPDNMWHLIIQINAGESVTEEVNYIVKSDMTIESKFETGSEAFGGLDIDKILGAKLEIKSFARENISNSVKESRELGIKYSKTYTLPPEPVNPLENAVKARGFFIGPEFIRLRLGIKKIFLPFRDEGYGWIDVKMHTGRHHTKQVDILTDGSRIDRITNIM